MTRGFSPIAKRPYTDIQITIQNLKFPTKFLFSHKFIYIKNKIVSNNSLTEKNK